jgi:hypothetical protein
LAALLLTLAEPPTLPASAQANVRALVQRAKQEEQRHLLEATLHLAEIAGVGGVLFSLASLSRAALRRSFFDQSLLDLAATAASPPPTPKQWHSWVSALSLPHRLRHFLLYQS